MFERTIFVLKDLNNPDKKPEMYEKYESLLLQLIQWMYQISLFLYLVNICMSILVGYAAYKRERTLLIIWLYYDAIYIPISALNVIAMHDWGSATMVFNIYFWVLVFELQRKLRDAHHWKMVILQCNAQL
jgi:hypothetical protein